MLRPRFFTIVPETFVYVVEQLGQFNKLLKPGFHFLIPFFHNISYIHSMKEQATKIPKQQAVTKDNVSINVSGVVFYKITDAYKASYNIENSEQNVMNLAQTVTRAQIGKLKLQKLFQERSSINYKVQKNVNSVTKNWGIETLRYEILSIDPPQKIKEAMTYEAAAERNRRRDIMLSEGKKISQIKVAEGQSQMRILRAEGTAKSIELQNNAQAKSLQLLSDAISTTSGSQAVKYILNTNYLKGLQETIKKSNMTVLPKGKKGNNEEGNDVMALATIMAMKGGMNNEIHGEGQQKQIDDFVQNMSKEDIQDFLKKYNFQSDPVLYDDPLDSNNPIY